MRRVLVGLVAVAVMAGWAGSVPAGASELVETPAEVDACTGVPDTVPEIYDFTAACQQHDICYAQGFDRLACDLAFREDLVAACEVQHPDVFDPRRYLCLSFAELYFWGVRLFGGSFFPT
jgi:hypothetical protein